MSYTITYVRSKGSRSRTVTLDMSERAAAAYCKVFAHSAHRVVLCETDDDGLPVIVGRWQNGRASRDLPDVNVPQPKVIDGEVEEDEDDHGTIAISLDEQTDDHDDHADAQVYEGFCVKCHEKRAFEGEIVITANGRRMAKGNCPVCGTKMNAIQKNLTVEEQESFDVPDDEPESPIEDSADLHILQKDDAGRGKVRLFCSCDEWETTVKRGTSAETRALAAFSEHAAEDGDHTDTDETAPEILPTDDPDYDEAAQQEAESAMADEDAGAAAAAEMHDRVIEAVAEVVPEATEEVLNAVSTPEFSDDPAKKATAKKTAPTKSAPAKSQPRNRAPHKHAESTEADDKAADAELQEVRNRRVAECPNCGRMVAVKEVPAAQIAYLMIHPSPKGPECMGSRASVEYVGG